jgi:hypothetical protein
MFLSRCVGIAILLIASLTTVLPSAYADQVPPPAEAQKPKPIGQKPEDEVDIRKIFLRQSTVLLRPGQLEVEASINYLNNQAVSPILNARFRQLHIPLSARIGLFNRAEGYLTVPVVYAHRTMSFADSGISHQESGIGDISAGLNYEIMRETAKWPDIIASARVGIPTGSKPNELGLSLGSGHWASSFGVQFIKTADPVALFWGINYTRQFEARYFFNDDYHSVNPGEMVGYNFGFGFAANENVSLSAQIAGYYQSGAEADGVKAFGSSSEPASFRSALTYRYSRRTYIEPSVVIGLDDDAADFAIGVSLTHRFGK